MGRTPIFPKPKYNTLNLVLQPGNAQCVVDLLNIMMFVIFRPFYRQLHHKDLSIIASPVSYTYFHSMKNLGPLLLVLLLACSFNLSAQKKKSTDYLVLHTGDTLRGKIGSTTWNLATGYHIKIKTTEGKQSFKGAEVDRFRKKGRYYMMRGRKAGEPTRAVDYIKFEVLTEGTIKVYSYTDDNGDLRAIVETPEGKTIYINTPSDFRDRYLPYLQRSDCFAERTKHEEFNPPLNSHKAMRYFHKGIAERYNDCLDQ